VDVNEDFRGVPILLLAIDKKDISMVKLLLQYNADVNISNQSGITPLWGAILNRDKQLAKLFIDKGANVNAEMNERATAVPMTVIFFIKGVFLFWMTN